MVDTYLHSSQSGLVDSQQSILTIKDEVKIRKSDYRRLHYINHQQTSIPTTPSSPGFKVKLKRGRLRVQYTDNPWEIHLLSGRDRNFLDQWLQVCPAGSIYLDPNIGVSAIEMWSDLAVKYGKKSFLGFERTRQLPRYRYPRQWLLKRCLDRLIGLGLLLILSPLLLLLTLLLHKSGSHRVITYQWYVGRDGKLFRGYEFNLDLAANQSSLNQSSLMGWKKWMQNSGIVKLPNLINVLRGEVSLIGRYPRQVVDALAMSSSQRRYLNAIPGLLTIYQSGNVGHDSHSYSQSRTHINSCELDYLRNWSLSKDIQILLKMVLSRINICK